MFRKLSLLLFLGSSFAACQFADAEQQLQVAVYKRSLGAKAVYGALLKAKGIRPTLVLSLKADDLLKYDALFIGAAKVTRPDDFRGLRTFVGCGGGLMLNHSSCGRYLPETLFPEVVRKVAGRREDTIIPEPANKEHPVSRGLPEKWEHAYYDHLLLEPGPKGEVLLKDREQGVVVVAGMWRAGRLVFNGTVPGYWYDPATYAQQEKEPTGGELQLVLNAIRWAGGNRLSTLDKAELEKRRQALDDALTIADMKKLIPTSDWFGTEMLRGSYLPRRPVNELGGKFFITYDAQTWRGYDLRKHATPEKKEFYRQRLRLDVQHLKWMGVTDIIFWTDVSGDRVNRPTDTPDSAVRFPHYDPLALLCETGEQEGVSVWASWHSCARGAAFAEKYCAKDGKGNLFKYGTRSYPEDLLSSAYRGRCVSFLDEYANKYAKFKSFKGLAIYDELWFIYPDFYEDDLPAFDAFCKRQFGESLPADIGERLAKHRGWKDTSDVWRRRFILFKQSVVTGFWKFLVTEAHKRKLQIGIELLDTSVFSSGWCWGIDSVELTRLGADFFVASGGKSAAQCYPNTYRWAHAHQGWGRYNTHCLRGGPGGIYFTFNQLWRLIMYANNPALPRQLARHIHNQRQWANAQSLIRVAVLHQQNTVQMLFADPRPNTNRSLSLMRTVSRSQPADTIFTRAHELFDSYRVLIAPPYSVKGLSPEVLEKLKQFLNSGGVIVSIHTDWTTSRPDLSREKDVTGEVTGVTYGDPLLQAPSKFTINEKSIGLQKETPRRAVKVLEGTKVLARFEKDGIPAITEKQIGKGKIISLHFDATAELERTENPELVSWLASLLRETSRTEVFVEGTGFQVMSALKKGNWVAVSLFPTEIPAKPKVSVDLKALGIEKDNYRMLMLGKDMEITRPGRVWGDQGHWKVEVLKSGFPVTIVDDHDRAMPLPGKFDLSSFNDWSKNYIETVTRGNWESVAKGQQKRTYAHEIVVLAPADEPVMPTK